MRRNLIVGAMVGAPILWATRSVWAGTGVAAEHMVKSGPAHGLDPMVLVGLAVILIVAKLGGEFFERVGQPAVLGELAGGIMIGNLTLLGLTAVEPLKTNEVIGAFAEVGVIILLFEVGLESNLDEMLKVGWSSLLVASMGIVASFFLGWGVSSYFVPGAPRLAHIFIGATLCATSVGITARVLRDMGKLTTREARIILSAAVIDDVLGLLILAVMVGAIRAAGAGTTLSILSVIIIAVKAILFLVGAIILGHYVTPHLFRGVGRFEGRGVLLAVSIAFCFLLAWVAAKVDLAPIVGAFAAGLVLDELHFSLLPNYEKRDLQQLLAPVGTVLIPIFFVLVGLRVDLRALARPNLLAFALALTLAAITGKQFCSLAAFARGINRLSIGLGMVPRGEVQLIFAGVGATLMLPNAQGVSEPVISAATFGAIVMVVIVTTLLTPPALKWSLARVKLNHGTGLNDPAREVAENSAEPLR